MTHAIVAHHTWYGNQDDTVTLEHIGDKEAMEDMLAEIDDQIYYLAHNEAGQSYHLVPILDAEADLNSWIDNVDWESDYDGGCPHEDSGKNGEYYDDNVAWAMRMVIACGGPLLVLGDRDKAVIVAWPGV